MKFSLASTLCILGLIATTGCTTTASISPEMAVTIERIHIDSTLTDELEYLKLGTTVFNNKLSKMPDPGILAQVESEFREEIVARGYQIAETADNADIILNLGHYRQTNYPSEAGVSGAGFFVHVTIGINHGILAQSSIRVAVLDARTGKQIAVSLFPESINSGIKRNVDRWDDFTEQEKNELLSILKKSLQGIAPRALNAVGLLPKSPSASPLNL